MSHTWTNDHGRNFDTYVFNGSHESLGCSETVRLAESALLMGMMFPAGLEGGMDAFTLEQSADLMLNENTGCNSDALYNEILAVMHIEDED